MEGKGQISENSFAKSLYCLNILTWIYKTNITTIYEEKLVYGPKDLLAWLGGALGIFVGYSFFDFAKHMILFFISSTKYSRIMNKRSP